MTTKREPIKSDFYYASAARQEMLAAEFRDMADKKSMKENGHECGHQFTVRVSIVGHSGISGEGPESHADANYADDLLPVTVRAHNLSEALHRAAMLPLSHFFPEEDAT